MQLEAKFKTSTHFLSSPNLGRLVLQEPIIRYGAMPVTVIKHQALLIIDGVCAVYMGSLLLFDTVLSVSPVMPPSKPKVSSSPEKLAEAPFDNALTDLVLQSSDKVNFHVFKNILSLASPIFTDMFDIPSPPSEKPHDEVHVVPLSEHSTALEVALRHIYPVRTTASKAEKLHYASLLAEFARKYQVEALDRFITGYLMDSIERDPVGVYAIAVTYGYNDIGTNAAQSCLTLPFSNLQSLFLRYATVEHVMELIRYHVACGEAASALASDRTWFSSLTHGGTFIPYSPSNKSYFGGGGPGGAGAGAAGGGSGISCPSCTMSDFTDQTANSHIGPGHDQSKRRIGPRCVWNYLHRSALVLARHPTAEAITTEAFVLKTNNCSSCARYMRGHMLELSAVLGGEIKNVVKQVSLSLYPLSHITMFNGACSYVAGPYPRLFPRDRAVSIPLLLQINRECKNGPFLFSKVRRRFGIAWRT